MNDTMLSIKHPYVWLFCGFAALGACQYGYDGVYFSGVSTLDVFLRDFGERNEHGEYEISPAALSIMTSMINLGELVGSLAAAPLNDVLGRKGVFMAGTAAIIAGTTMQLVTTSSGALMTAGRAVLGFGVGNFSATSPLYMGVSTVQTWHAADFSISSKKKVAQSLPLTRCFFFSCQRKSRQRLFAARC